MFSCHEITAAKVRKLWQRKAPGTGYRKLKPGNRKPRNFGFTNQESNDYAATIFTGSVEFKQQYL